MKPYRIWKKSETLSRREILHTFFKKTSKYMRFIVNFFARGRDIRDKKMQGSHLVGDKTALFYPLQNAINMLEAGGFS
jgi:hypothetical protein